LIGKKVLATSSLKALAQPAMLCVRCKKKGCIGTIEVKVN
jgi:hypothetical protein